jgi:hypothetical protein
MTASARRPTYYQASGRPVDEEKRLRLIEAQRAVRVVSELAEHPGAEGGTEPWLAAHDLGVRV